MKSKNTVGKFIVFEGLDNSGKSTQLQLLSEKLSIQGIDHICAFEPGDTEEFRDIRKSLLFNKLKLDPLAETFLFLADRTQHVKAKILPALNSGKWVLCDRFTWSTLAYQGYGRQIDDLIIPEFLSRQGILPDLTIFIDISVQESLRRSGKFKDKIESESIEFFNWVYQGYKDLELSTVMANKDSIFTVNGFNSVNCIHADIAYNVYNRFKKEFI